MRARMGLVIANIPFEIIEVDLKNKPAEMIEFSSKATVPVLVTSDGRVIDESLDIISWACGDNFDHNLVMENDGYFKRNLDRYKYPNRYEDEDCSDARDNAEVFLKKLNTIVNIKQTTLTDICIFPFVRQCANVDRIWFDALPYPHLQQWLDFHINRELFRMIFDKKFKGILKN